ncbi:hypothetical protein ACFS5N_05370 [Mucilaginibacter ximonensis]|uniref:Uncharacterized protein n=1 Tax=Mucilaginibacter ximonensis TaxID=538021 RepID=A0ABW5Y9G3_9SPHI
MKPKILIALCILFGVALIGNRMKAQTKTGNISISVSEDEKTYEFSAKFDAEKMPKVLGYMDDHLKGAGISFKNTQADADLTLDNKMIFHMKSSPGKLAFKFDKRKNSAEFYRQFKAMCEGLRDLIQQK